MVVEGAHQTTGATPPDAGPQQHGQSGILDRPEVQQAGWVWGDTGAQPPVDAPLPALVTVAIRLVGAFIGSTAQCTGIGPAGVGEMQPDDPAVGWLPAAFDVTVADKRVHDRGHRAGRP